MSRVWTNIGVKVQISTSDITTKEGCRELLEYANKSGPVAAIFNLAAVLYDASVENQTPENFIKCLAPKAVSTKYLDELSRTMCPDLKLVP